MRHALLVLATVAGCAHAAQVDGRAVQGLVSASPPPPSAAVPAAGTHVWAVSTKPRASEPTGSSPLLDGLGGLQLSLPETEPVERPPAPPIILACGPCFAYPRRSSLSRPFAFEGEVGAISGGLSGEIVHRVLRQSAAGMRLCFTHDGDPARPVIGGMRVTFVIGSDGAVGDTGYALSGYAGGSVAACVLRAVRALVFPASPAGPTTVTYQLTARRA